MTFGAADVSGLAAHVVLSDCRACLDRLEKDDDNTFFRINWVAMCALLRTVGYVLAKIDRPKLSLATQQVIDAKWEDWKSLPKHSIFPNFIEYERNSVIKEYEFGYGEGLISVTLAPVSGGDNVIYNLPPSIYRPYRPDEDFDFSGDDVRDVAKLAIDWWEKELSEIETVMRDSN